MRREILEELLAARAARRPVALLTRLDSGEQWLVAEGGEPPSADLAQALADAFRTDRSTTVEAAGGRTFVHVFNAPPRMIIVGAVHVAQALAPMAAMTGFDVTVIDPRRAFASDARFPGVEVLAEWPDEAMGRIALDRRTAVITLTHDPKVDDPALECALRSEVFYIGSLGSRRTHAARLERLAGRGFGEAELGRIHGPAGLDLGGRSPPEIALSILAEATRVLRRGAAE